MEDWEEVDAGRRAGEGGCVGGESVNLQDGEGGERAKDIWRHLNTKGAAAQVAIAAVNKGATRMH